MNTVSEENMRRLKLLESRRRSSGLVVRWELVETVNRVDVTESLLDSEVAPMTGCAD